MADDETMAATDYERCSRMQNKVLKMGSKLASNELPREGRRLGPFFSLGCLY